MRRAIFLDRDGVQNAAVMRKLNGLENAVCSPWKMSELVLEPNLGEAVQIFKDFGYLTIVITNQPDVAYGYVAARTWQKIHNTIMAAGKPDDCFMCRHPEKDKCPLKKPSGLMLKAAADKWGINLKKSFMIGDTWRDVYAARDAGCTSIGVRRPYNEKPINAIAKEFLPDILVSSLLEATTKV